MPEPTTPTTPQAGDAGVTPGQEPTNTTPTTPQAGKSQDDYDRMIADLRKENASHRTKLKAFEDAQAQADQAKLSETERLTKQASDLQSKYDEDTTTLQARIVRYEVERQAQKLGIIDPDAAAQLIDWDALDIADDGTPKNADSLLKDLLKNKPYLAGKPQQATAGGATNPGRAAGNGQITEQFVTDLLSGKMPQSTYEQLSSGQRHEVQLIMQKRRHF